MIATVNPLGAQPVTVIVDHKLNDKNINEDPNGEGLRRAGRGITGCIWEDCRLPDPAELLSRSIDEATLAADLSPAMQSITEGVVKLARLVVIPELLLCQYTDKSRCFMGFVEPIGRAWMTVDEKLYLWDFKNNKDIACWHGEPSNGPIIDICLTSPKKGVFVEAIKHLLIIVTPIEVRLLGVQASDNGDILLHDTNLIFGTDQVNMLSTTSDKFGRIFCGGQDGHIYEMEYEAEEGWFIRRCRKVNRTGSVLSRLAPTFLKPSQFGISSNVNAITSLHYDQSRQVIWSLSESNIIDGYNVQDGNWSHTAQFFFVPEDIQRHWNLTRTTVGDRIVSIHPIGLEESSSLCLLAVTQAGLRLYYGASNPNNSQDWRLLQVRAPQPIHDLKPSGGSGAKFNMTFLAASMAQIHSSYQKAGLYISAGALSDEEDILSIKSIRGTTNASEISGEWRLEGKVWEIAETSRPALHEGSISNWWSDLIYGHETHPRQLLVLTNAGIYVFEKERPVDALSRLLLACGGNVDNESIQAFFGRHLSTDQAIATALILATKPDFGDVSFWATNAIFKYAGEPSASSSGEFLPSSLHIGLYRFVGRLLSSIWKIPIFKLGIFDNLIEPLRRLLLFFRSNSSFILRIKAPSSEPLKYENSSLEQLENLTSRTIELLMFLSICLDYNLNFGQLIEPDVDLELLASSAIRGPILIREIGSALVRQQLHLQASVESLCAVLRDRSPTFFSSADVQEYEGTDALERALRHSSRSIREQLLAESLQCYQRATSHMSIEALGKILDRYREARYYVGILTLGAPHVSLHERVLSSLGDLLHVSFDDNGREMTSVISMALGSKNSVFRNSFYDWIFRQSIAGSILLSTDRIDNSLLEYLENGSFESSTIDTFLLKSRARADIYWKYLTRHQELKESGKVLIKLAKSLTSDPTILPLSDRIQYLSVAITTLKSCQTISHEVASEAEELLEVALVQLDLLRAFSGNEDVSYRLNCRLYDLTTMFIEFSEPFGLSDISLLIVHTAGHADPILVSRLWQRLLTDNLDVIGRKFKTICSKLYPSDIAFPMAYLVDMLALIAYKSISEEDDEKRLAQWFKSLWGNNIPYEVVSEQINTLLKSSTKSFWSLPEHKRFLRLLL